MNPDKTSTAMPAPIIPASTPIKKAGDLLSQLLSRGDPISIECGRLVLISASGNAVPNEWLQENEATLIEQIAMQTSLPIFRYTEYTTGKYDKHLFAGVTLQFDCITTLDSAYVIFNCILTRARTTKHGAADKPLPNKHFRLSNKHKLLEFLRRAGIQPRRLSEAYKSMHKLEDLLFTGCYLRGSKLDKDSLTPLNLTYSELLELLKTPRQVRDNSATKQRQVRDNSATKHRDKESVESVTECGFQSFSTTSVSNYGYKNNVTREHGKRVSSSSSSNSKVKTPQNQSHEDWLKDYEADA